MKKIFKIVFFVWLAVTIIGAPFYWPYLKSFITYNPIIFSANYSEPESDLEARIQDLKYLRKLTSYDRSFNQQEAKLFELEIDDIEKESVNLSEAGFYLAISKAVALANNGHTNLNFWPLFAKFNNLGLKFTWFSDGLFVTSAIESRAHFLGYKVVGVEGRSIDEVSNSLSQYTGGNSQWKKLHAPFKIESPEILFAAGLSESADQVSLVLEDTKGFSKSHVFEAMQELDADMVWSHVLDKVEEPLSAQKLENPMFSRLSNNGFYIRTKSGYETQDMATDAFYDLALSEVEEGSLDYMVVDFRVNGGGNYLKAIDFAKSAPNKIKEGGHLYLVVGPNTFSAAIVTTAMLKYYGGVKSKIVGSPMGDDESFWAERGTAFRLPNSDVQIFYATGYHDWNKGCDEHPFCFTMNKIHGVKAGSLAPEILIEPRFQEYANGKDVVMDWVMLEQENEF